MRVLKGPSVPVKPVMSVVIMSVNSDPRAAHAAASVSGDNIEKILVNTGCGTLSKAIDLHDIILLEDTQIRMPGGTRNLGIKLSSAPVISFLASDCIADGDAMGKRILFHSAGYKLVSSALRPYSNALGSWLSYIYIHRKRMPEFQKDRGSFFGASYSRCVFDEVGLFDESVRVSEDQIFNDKCAHMSALQAADIITYHRYPETVLGAIRDAGERAVRERKHRNRSRARQAASEIFRSLRLFGIAFYIAPLPARARYAALCMPLLGVSAALYCIFDRNLNQAKS